MTRQHPTPTDECLLTPRLELVPVTADEAEELTEVFGDQRLYVFLGSRPATMQQLREQFTRLVAARLANKEGTAQRNWTVRRRRDGRAVVGWLERRGVTTITAHIHPDHHASAKVARRAGLRPTGEYRDHEGIREQRWRRLVT